MGESAGGQSVDALVTSPPDPLPFRAAIMESGQGSINSPISADLQTYADSWKNLTELANCPSDGVLDCLRKIPALQLKHIVHNASLSFGPVPDGGVTWSGTARLDRLHSTKGNSSIARVPILIGNNADEAKTYVSGCNDTRKCLLTAVFGGNVKTKLRRYVDKLLKAYPLGAPGAHTENDRASLIVTDFAMHCPIATYANDSAQVGIPTWRYLFNASFPNNEASKEFGAYHAAEIPFVFGTYSKKNVTEFEKEVSHTMQKAWADFAKDPTQGPGWKQVPTIGVFGDGVKVGMSAEGKKALSTSDSKAMDRRCQLYKSIDI